MREIKYRLWCKEREEMMDIRKMHFENGELVVVSCVDHDSDFAYFPEDNDHVLMQYTGLKDVNGREIYEGDIVKGYIGANNQEYIGVCEYSLKIAGFKFGNKKTNSYSKSTVTTARLKNKEVIGNLYENPELLEGK